MEKMQEIGSTITGLKKTLADWAKKKGLEGNRNFLKKYVYHVMHLIRLLAKAVKESKHSSFVIRYPSSAICPLSISTHPSFSVFTPVRMLACKTPDPGVNE